MVAIDVEDFGCRLSVVGYRLGSLDCARDDSCGLWVVGWHSGLILNANQKYEFDLECGIALGIATVSFFCRRKAPRLRSG